MKYLIYSIFLLLTALAFFSYRFWGYEYAFTEKTEILQNFSFEINSDGRGGKNYQYYIHFANDYTNYQIPAKFINYFKIIEFEREVNRGDSLTVITSPDKNKLNGNFTIYGIHNSTKSYLELKNTRNADWLEKNIALPFFFLFFAFIAFLNFKKFRINRKKTSANHKFVL